MRSDGKIEGAVTRGYGNNKVAIAHDRGSIIISTRLMEAQWTAGATSKRYGRAANSREGRVACLAATLSGLTLIFL
ncbi:hypothetical protein Acr_15g0008140 [Actinidia rufa]|uniref:Uncharacterized protein n=1 Tax=Actinidia rufa TaxID=165716 RepID=A0A7J0FU28_9ERIC|nr:hypothetical protein Acr_15g0008140 [Actinidia rufa]